MAGDLTHWQVLPFWDDQLGLVQQHIRVATGSSSYWIRLRIACCDWAVDRGMGMWAIPSSNAEHADGLDHVEWMVFTHDRRTSKFLKKFPNREAAEMWLIHNAK